MAHQPERGALLELAVRMAREAAAVIIAAAPRVRTIDWRAKSPSDFVSEVDLGAEERILAIAARELPEAVILAEETAAQTPPDRVAAGLAIVADPLDGTTNFLHGFPQYAVSIAILERGQPVAAVVLDAAHGTRGECFTATAGGGAFVDGARLTVSSTTEPLRALIGTGFPFKDPEDVAPYQAQMAKVMANVSGVRRPGSAALDLASVAAGRFDAFWENRLSPWDFAAGMLLVQEAGGVMSTVEGGELKPVAPSSVLAGNAPMHAWLRDTLR